MQSVKYFCWALNLSGSQLQSSKGKIRFVRATPADPAACCYIVFTILENKIMYKLCWSPHTLQFRHNRLNIPLASTLYSLHLNTLCRAWCLDLLVNAWGVHALQVQDIWTTLNKQSKQCQLLVLPTHLTLNPLPVALRFHQYQTSPPCCAVHRPVDQRLKWP